jgi:hypothetical protein
MSSTRTLLAFEESKKVDVCLENRGAPEMVALITITNTIRQATISIDFLDMTNRPPKRSIDAYD